MSRRPLIVFVCTGNTCRSPMAEIAFARRLKENGLEWRCASAGVSAPTGLPASEAACRTLAARGLNGGAHRSRPLTPELVDAAEMIVVMTHSHREIVQRRFPEAAARVFLLRDFDSRSRGEDVEDPIGGTPGEYDRILDRIEAAFPELILALHECGKKDGLRGKERP